MKERRIAMSEKKARALGINHVVLEVGDLDEALEFYGAIFDFKLRGKSDHNAFIDMGDQFIQLSLGKPKGRTISDISALSSMIASRCAGLWKSLA
jgi:catechol-2,3-dioxygenase